MSGGLKFRKRRCTGCPLYPRKRTCAVHHLMSALGQKRTLMHCSSKGSLFDHLVCTGLQCRRHVEAKRLGKLPTHHRIIACADERRSETLSGVQDSGEMYSVAIASRFSAAARTKTIVNSVAHMVDAPRFPGTDLEAACQL
jgi:hypothetical protein